MLEDNPHIPSSTLGGLGSKRNNDNTSRVKWSECSSGKRKSENDVSCFEETNVEFCDANENLHSSAMVY
jgi:hypothetical protein